MFNIVSFQHCEHLFKTVTERMNGMGQNPVTPELFLQIVLKFGRIIRVLQNDLAEGPSVAIADTLPDDFGMGGLHQTETHRDVRQQVVQLVNEQIGVMKDHGTAGLKLCFHQRANHRFGMIRRTTRLGQEQINRPALFFQHHDVIKQSDGHP